MSWDAGEEMSATLTIEGVTGVQDEPVMVRVGPDAATLTMASTGTTLSLKYMYNKSVKVEGPTVSVVSSLDGHNTATFRLSAAGGEQAAAGIAGGIQQATTALLLRLEDQLSEACAEVHFATILVYDVSPTGRSKLSFLLKKLNIRAEFVETWTEAVEMVRSSASEYAAFLCDISPEGGWSRIEAGGERGTSGWDVTRALVAAKLEAEEGGGVEGGVARLTRCRTSVPVIGIGNMGGDETAKDPRARTVPVSSVICHCEEAGMLTYVSKPFTGPKLRQALAGIVPGVKALPPGDDVDSDPEEEAHLDEAVDDWMSKGGWFAKLAMVPFRISRFGLRYFKSLLPLWVVHVIGTMFGSHFKNK